MLSILLFEAEYSGENITWLLWVALGFFGLMVLIGWLTSRKKNEASNQIEEHPNHENHD